MNDRFIPLHIIYDKIAPEDPTKAPVIISKSFDNINPAAAAAQPAVEFNREMTTGSSAPPMAITICQPINQAMPVITSRQVREFIDPALMTNKNISIRDTTIDTTKAVSFNEYESGLEAIIPCNLPKATMDPVKVRAPIKTPRYISVNSIFNNTPSNNVVPV